MISVSWLHCAGEIKVERIKMMETAKRIRRRGVSVSTHTSFRYT